MKRKKIDRVALFFALVVGCFLMFCGNEALAAQYIPSVVEGTKAISTTEYTKTENGKVKWDSENGQYLYLGKKKYHLLERDGDGIVLRTAEQAGGGNNVREIDEKEFLKQLSLVEQRGVKTVDLPEEVYTVGSTTYKAPEEKQVKIYQLSLNDVIKYYGGFSDNYLGYTRSVCIVNKYGAYYTHDFETFTLYGALQFDLSNVAYTMDADVAKPVQFANIAYLNESNSNRLTLKDGTGFEATLSSNEVQKGGSVTVNVTKLPTDNVTDYTQISAMAVDLNGNVVAYGKIGDVKTGEIPFTLPSAIKSGQYKLKIFAEAVSTEKNATDYASNMVECSLNVAQGNDISVNVSSVVDSHLQLESGREFQTVTKGTAITPIVYKVTKYTEANYGLKAVDGYYIQQITEKLLKEQGLNELVVSVSEKGDTITISGTPTEDTNLVIPAADKQKEAGVQPWRYIFYDEKGIGGTKANMVWRAEGEDTLHPCTDQLTEIDWSVYQGKNIQIAFKTTPEYPSSTFNTFDAMEYYKISKDITGKGIVKVKVLGVEAQYEKWNAYSGRSPELEIIPEEGYQCKKIWITKDEDDTEVQMNRTETGTTFEMPNGAVTVHAIFEVIAYDISVAEVKGGKVTASAKQAEKGTEVSLTAEPEQDYQLVRYDIVSDDTDNKTIVVTGGKFIMPAGNVRIIPVFVQKEKKDEETKKDENTKEDEELKKEDVKKDDVPKQDNPSQGEHQKPEISILNQTKASRTSITFTWAQKTNATAGYRIYIKGGKYKKFTKVVDVAAGKTSYTVKKVAKKQLSAGTQYEIKIVSLKKSGSKKVEKETQKLKTVTTTAAPKFSSAKRSKNGKTITLNWKKVSGANGYIIQMSTKAKTGFKNIKTVSAKTKSFARKNLKKGKTYYFRMRTYKTVNGKKFYSSWSKIKKVK